MRVIAVIAGTIFTLTACGGGGSDSNTSDSTGQGGSGGGTNTPSQPQACSNSPVITSSSRYLGVLPTGQVGEFSFDTAAGTKTHSLEGVQSVAPLKQSASCSYTSTDTGILQTSFLANGLALSAARTAGAAQPVMLVKEPESDLAKVSGTYNVLRYETEKNGSARSSYAGFNVNNAGEWQLCPGSSYSATCTNKKSGTLTPNINGGFNLMLGNSTLGRVVPKTLAASKILLVGIADTGAGVQGMWVGATNEAFSPGQSDGVYVTNTVEHSTSLLSLAGLTVKPEARPTPVQLLANQPVQGVFSIVTGDPLNDIGIATPDGLYADVTQADPKGDPFMRLGVKQVQ